MKITSTAMPSVTKGPILKVANLERLRRSSTLLELRFASRLKNALILWPSGASRRSQRWPQTPRFVSSASSGVRISKPRGVKSMLSKLS